MEILSPVGMVMAQAGAAPAGVSDLRNKKVAILNNGWAAMGPIVDQLVQRLEQDYGVAEVIQEASHMSSATPAEVLDRAARSADLAIVGLAT